MDPTIKNGGVFPSTNRDFLVFPSFRWFDVVFFFPRKNGSQVHEKSRGVHRSGGKLTWPYILGSFGPFNVVANQPTPPHPPRAKDHQVS